MWNLLNETRKGNGLGVKIILLFEHTIDIIKEVYKNPKKRKKLGGDSNKNSKPERKDIYIKRWAKILSKLRWK